MAEQYFQVLRISVTAGTNITQRRMVNYSGNRAGAGSPCLGVALATTDADDQVAVDVLGIVEVETGGAVAVGAALESDSVGRVNTHSGTISATANRIVGRARTSATAAGQIIDMVLIPN